MKFGVVGLIAFAIDFGILNLLVVSLHMNNVVAATISFTIALCFNYLASMRFVFKHREDMARWMEMLIFVVSSVIGLFINDAIIALSTAPLPADAIHTDHAKYVLFTNIGKIIATVVVAVWNFVSGEKKIKSSPVAFRHSLTIVCGKRGSRDAIDP